MESFAIEVQRTSRVGVKPKNIVYFINENDCHICISHSKKTYRYPIIMLKRKNYTITRYLYQKKYGEIQKGLVLRHTCDNKRCINLDHIILGTSQDNANDMVKRGRSLMGVKNPANRLSENKVKEIFLNKDLKYDDLAKKYNVHKATIEHIKHRKQWCHVTKNL